MKKKRKVPLRKCLGCNEMKPKKELIRIVRSPEGKVSIDKVGKAPGRGCYICPSLQCLETAVKGKRVIIAGLDMDSNGKPFGPMPALLTVSEYITKLHAICVNCGSLASHSHRLTTEVKDLVYVGGKSEYEPLCRKCFYRKTAGEVDEENNFMV